MTTETPTHTYWLDAYAKPIRIVKIRVIGCSPELLTLEKAPPNRHFKVIQRALAVATAEEVAFKYMTTLSKEIKYLGDRKRALEKLHRKALTLYNKTMASNDQN